ncbi:MAG TPA: hypothetical protein VKA34_09765, partial [Balneolales bacterium]|nr:hypothetical protein [Balneolales bacterium]
GEFQAAEKLTDAGRVIGEVPAALLIRFLQTMREMSGENNTFTFIPVPIEILEAFTKGKNESGK